MKDGVLDRLALAWAGISPLYRPPDWWGDPGAGLPALTGAPRQLLWQAVVSASVPGLTGEEHRFAVPDQGTTITADGVAPELIDPLARAVEQELEPPYCAIAVHDEGNVWSAGANRARIVDLPIAGDEVCVTRVGGAVTTTVDGEEKHDLSLPVLEDLIAGDGTVMAHRFVGATWVAETFPL